MTHGNNSWDDIRKFRSMNGAATNNYSTVNVFYTVGGSLRTGLINNTTQTN